MAGQTKGSLETRVLAEGDRAFHLRFQVERRRESLVLHECPGCSCGCGGGWTEATARQELADLIVGVRAGFWRPRPPRRLAGRRDVRPMPTFGEYAASWLDAKIAGVLGDRPIAENTIKDYRARLRHLAYLEDYPLDQIDPGLCVDFKAHLLAESGDARRQLSSGLPMETSKIAFLQDK